MFLQIKLRIKNQSILSIHKNSKVFTLIDILIKMENSQSNEIRNLKMQVAKLQLESKLRRNLASEIDKQKQIAND